MIAGDYNVIKNDKGDACKGAMMTKLLFLQDRLLGWCLSNTEVNELANMRGSL